MNSNSASTARRLVAWRVLFFPLALLCAAFAHAQSAGTVQFVSGTVQIIRGTTTLPATKSMIVNEGDVVKTAANSNLQITLIDGAFVSVRPGSEMRIEKYSYNTAQPTLSDAVLLLVVGTMRTFTGEIVNRNRDNFKMRTPIATLGIRGSGNVLANYPDSGTINHTLTGAHSVTSKDASGRERTLISTAGQTIQVLPGQAPRYIPTPAFIAQASSPAPKAAASSSTADSDKTAAAPDATVVAAPAAPSAAPPPPTPTSASQATTATVAAVVAANTQIVGAVFAGRTAELISPTTPSIGFDATLVQSNPNTTAVLNAAGQLIELRNFSVSSSLVGSALPPQGYSASTDANQSVVVVSGTHFDGSRNADGSVVIGRWGAGSVFNVTDNTLAPTDPNYQQRITLSATSFPYMVVRPTASSVLSAFTGTSTYTLLAATTPIDGNGATGRFNSATVGVNFGNLTATLAAALSINNQNLSMNGSTSFGRGAALINWTTGSNTLTVGCSGTGCAPLGYDAAAGVAFGGAGGASMGGSYRINPTRTSGSGYSNVIVGTFSLQAASNPKVAVQGGIDAPRLAVDARLFGVSGLQIQQDLVRAELLRLPPKVLSTAVREIAQTRQRASTH